jgi:hypothetical protein
MRTTTLLCHCVGNDMAQNFRLYFFLSRYMNNLYAEVIRCPLGFPSQQLLDQLLGSRAQQFLVQCVANPRSTVTYVCASWDRIRTHHFPLGENSVRLGGHKQTTLSRDPSFEPLL